MTFSTYVLYILFVLELRSWSNCENWSKEKLLNFTNENIGRLLIKVKEAVKLEISHPIFLIVKLFNIVLDSGIIPSEWTIGRLYSYLTNENILESISNELHIYLQIFCLLYADDTLVLAESAIELQNALDSLYTYCNKWALNINVDKTKVIIFSKGRIKRINRTIRKTCYPHPTVWLILMISIPNYSYYLSASHNVFTCQGNVKDFEIFCFKFIQADYFFWILLNSIIDFFLMGYIVYFVVSDSIGKVLCIDPPSRSPGAGLGAMQSRRLGVRMLVAVVVAFFLCWAPFHMQRLFFAIVTTFNGWDYELYKDINDKLFLFTGTFFYLSSAINPVLYSIMSTRFRKALHHTFFGRRGRNRSSKHQYLVGNYRNHRISRILICTTTTSITTTTSTFSSTTSAAFYPQKDELKELSPLK
ncbi:unnamed protein product, partial [Meganyctiphanes norvegica]